MEPHTQHAETLRLIVKLAVAVMATDGQITPAELEAIRGLESLGIGSVGEIVREEIEQAMLHPIDLADAYEQLAFAAPQAKAAVLVALIDVALADRNVSAAELGALRRIAGGLRIPPALAQSLFERFSDHAPIDGANGAKVEMPSVAPRDRNQPAESRAPLPAAPAAANDPFRTLGLSAGATREEIDRAYLALVEQYDPVKLVTLGPEFVALAVTKLAALTRSFEAARRAIAADAPQSE